MVSEWQEMWGIQLSAEFFSFCTFLALFFRRVLRCEIHLVNERLRWSETTTLPSSWDQAWQLVINHHKFCGLWCIGVPVYRRSSASSEKGLFSLDGNVWAAYRDSLCNQSEGYLPFSVRVVGNNNTKVWGSIIRLYFVWDVSVYIVHVTGNPWVIRPSPAPNPPKTHTRSHGSG